MSARPRSTTGDGVPNAVRETAALWFGRKERGFSAAEEREFAAWLAANEGNAQAFAELDATWRTLDCARSLRPRGEPDPHLLAPRSSSKRIGATLLAAAAALAIGYVSWWRPTFGAFHGSTVTQVGEAQALTLPDGSIVRLNTDSVVTVRYTAAVRQVTLERGEAYFTVARNRSRPFLVEAGPVAVRAVGTAFNVRLGTDDVDVLVTEGVVRVAGSTRPVAPTLAASRPPDSDPPAAPPGAEPVVTAGQRVTIAASRPFAHEPPIQVPPLEIERLLAWRQQRLQFVAEPMSAVVAQFNRYNRHRLVIADPRLAEVRFGGSFRPDAHDTMVRLLETNFGVIAERQEHQTLLRLAP